jgi:hypothetical protein
MTEKYDPGFSTFIQNGKEVTRRNKPYKVVKAMSLAKGAIQELQEVFELMSDRQRKIFVSLAKGYDSLKAFLDAGIREQFGIVKIVYDKEEKPVYIDKVTLDNVDKLNAASYQRLLNITDAALKDVIKDYRPEDFIVDVRKLFKLVAPDALNTLTEIATNKSEKASDRISAAKDLLDRAGYKEEVKKDIFMPVQVNILMNEQAKPMEVTKISYAEEQNA